MPVTPVNKIDDLDLHTFEIPNISNVCFEFGTIYLIGYRYRRHTGLNSLMEGYFTHA